MTQVERITKMESLLNESTAAVQELSSVLDKYQGLLGKIDKLSQYYGSADWFADFDDSNNGKLPQELKCGVLSEDAVFNLLEENRDLAIRMLELATKLLK